MIDGDKAGLSKDWIEVKRYSSNNHWRVDSDYEKAQLESELSRITAIRNCNKKIGGATS